MASAIAPAARRLRIILVVSVSRIILKGIRSWPDYELYTVQICDALRNAEFRLSKDHEHRRLRDLAAAEKTKQALVANQPG
jgi:hypothetical protein